MSSFQVLIQRIYIKPHPNADALDLGNIGSPDGWQVVTRKGLYQSGDLVAYIPESAVCPEWLLKHFGFWNETQNKGLLAGPNGDRCKMVRLRGEPSLGICLPIKSVPEKALSSALEVLSEDGKIRHYAVVEGQNVAELLGVIKYVPPIPVHMAGEVFNASTLIGVNYDIEDLKKFPHVIQSDEEVQVTVKLHGTNLQAVWLHPDIKVVNPKLAAEVNLDEWIDVVDDHDHQLGFVAIASKGMGAQGLFFKSNEANAQNVYLRAFSPYLINFAHACLDRDAESFTMVGEVFGKGVQQGFDYGLKEISFRAFDVYTGYRGQAKYMDDAELDDFLNSFDIPRVPIVYRGPYSFAIIDELANAAESEFKCSHVREGVIIKPVIERRDSALGRVALKHRSTAYMLKATGEELQ